MKSLIKSIHHLCH